MAQKKASTFVEKLIYLVTLVGLIVAVNYMYFTYWAPQDQAQTPSIKVDHIGDTVFLRYAHSEESYAIDGIEGGGFVYTDGAFVFSNPAYCVRKNGNPYNIVNSNGECVGQIHLVRAVDMEHSRMEVDAARYTSELLKVPATCTSLRIYTSVPQGERPLSIQVEQRETPLEITFENVSLTAPDLCPLLYSLSASPIDVKIVGNVSLTGGKNPYHAADISGMDRLLDTVGTAANAYCVVMVSAVGGAASIYKGAEYYADMFEGITSLQLATLENAWGKVESLFNGEDGATGLDGIPAIQLTGDLNIMKQEGAALFLRGGQGARGGDGVGGFTNTTRGGRGGNGASALVCDRLFNGLGYGLMLYAGEGGEGGAGGKNILGEQGPFGAYGQSQADRVIFSQIEINHQ